MYRIGCRYMHPLILSGIVLFAYMSTAFIIALLKKDNGVADIAYGGGFMLLAGLTYYLSPETPASIIVSALTFIWGTRLSLRIFKRNWNRPEDFRYAAWRSEWGNTFVIRSFLQVFMLQGAIIFIVALPVLLTNVFAVPSYTLLTLAGLVLWVIGFLFESIGDAQLDAFIKKTENKGKIVDQGLWKYTRHPNYFGEALMWWAMAIIAMSVLGDPLLIALAFVSPLLITFLLLKVSGVPMLEKKMAGNPAWEVYAKKTSVFVPWFPRG